MLPKRKTDRELELLAMRSSTLCSGADVVLGGPESHYTIDDPRDGWFVVELYQDELEGAGELQATSTLDAELGEGRR